MSNRKQLQNAPTEVQELTVPFTCRSVPGEIHVTCSVNTDSAHACGLDVIFPHVPSSDLTSQFGGFPVVKATVQYAGPSSPFSSYSQLFGWIQFVKIIPTKSGVPSTTAEWKMDIYPWAQDLKSPFCFWGHNPTAFDAPARMLDEEAGIEEVVWRAQSFLCVLEDAGISKRVRVLGGAGFGWGFDVKNVQDDGKLDRTITVTALEQLDMVKEWSDRLVLLRKEYPDWTFGDEIGY